MSKNKNEDLSKKDIEGIIFIFFLLLVSMTVSGYLWFSYPGSSFTGFLFYALKEIILLGFFIAFLFALLIAKIRKMLRTTD